ncbi:unnamed protein product, partial [Coregonus sp. 'balchen']
GHLVIPRSKCHSFSGRGLKQVGTGHLVIPRSKCHSFSGRALNRVGSRLWNSLPPSPSFSPS